MSTFRARLITSEDIYEIWLRQLARPFFSQAGTFAEFSAEFLRKCKSFNEMFVVEESRLLCFIGARFNGWAYEPHVTFLPDVNGREVFQGTCWFVREMQQRRDIGVCVIKCLKSSLNLFQRVANQTDLIYVGMIPKGDYRGDEYIFSVSGRLEFPGALGQPRLYWTGEREWCAS